MLRSSDLPALKKFHFKSNKFSFLRKITFVPVQF